MVAFGMVIKITVVQKEKRDTLFSSFHKRLLLTVAVLMAIKMLLQLLTAFPYFADLAATILDFTIGYLHWTFLGVVTLSLFLFLDYFELLKIPMKAYIPYLMGFVSTETLIFYKGIIVWYGLPIFEGYYVVLAVASLLIPLSLILMVFLKK